MPYQPSNPFNPPNPSSLNPNTPGTPSYNTYIFGTGNVVRPAAKWLETVETDQPLVGFRAWKVDKVDNKWFLKSTFKPTLWPHREKLVRGEKAPVNSLRGLLDDFSLGIHAVKEKHKLGELCVNYTDAKICGEIYMWGEVTETQYGWLAQYAYPKQLWVMADMDPTVIMDLEENYGVPVIVNEAVEMCYKSQLEAKKRINELEYICRNFLNQDPRQMRELYGEMESLKNRILELHKELQYYKEREYRVRPGGFIDPDRW